MIAARSVAQSRACLSAVVVTAALLLAACQRSPSTLSARDFEAGWHDLLVRRDYAAAQKLIDQRESALPGDPEVAIARANLYFRRATGPAAGFASGGRASGVAGDSAGIDTLLARRALDALSDGIARNPERLDIRLGLAFLCQQLGMPMAEVQVVQGAVAYARQHPDALRWSYGEPLALPAEQYVPQSLHDYVRFYADRGAPGDEGPMLALAHLVMETYPNSPHVPNDVAFFYGQRNDWKTSLEYLKHAERADSSDALVLYNLGWAHEQLKQRAPALRYYRRAAAAGAAGRKSDIASSASQRLAALGAAP